MATGSHRLGETLCCDILRQLVDSAANKHFARWQDGLPIVDATAETATLALDT